LAAEGLPTIEEAVEPLRHPHFKMRFNLRLHPQADPKVAFNLIDKKLKANPPFNAKVTTKMITSGRGWQMRRLPDW
jgi:hypothetical protein